MEASIRTVLLFAAVVALAALPAGAHAGIVQHDTEASWLAAVGGSADVTEDFSTFSSDTSFVSSPVALSMGTIVQTTL